MQIPIPGEKGFKPPSASAGVEAPAAQAEAPKAAPAEGGETKAAGKDAAKEGKKKEKGKAWVKDKKVGIQMCAVQRARRTESACAARLGSHASMRASLPAVDVSFFSRAMARGIGAWCVFAALG